MQCEANCKNGERCKNKPKGDAFCLLHKECPVCYDNKRLKKLSCEHYLCGDCSKKWLSTHTTCPICRKYVKPQPQQEISLTEAILMTMILDPSAFVDGRRPDVEPEQFMDLVNILYG